MDTPFEGYRWPESPLSSAMSIYRRTFGHSVPSYEIKNAALFGTNDQLAGLILAYVGCGEPNTIWASAKHPYEHEYFELGLSRPEVADRRKEGSE